MPISYNYKNYQYNMSHNPKYPKIIYFCNKTISNLDMISCNNWKELNKDYEIKMYDDEMIKSFLLEEYGNLYLNIFNYLENGPIKADFFRICILYKNGGIYSDIDNMPLVSLSDFIENDIDFVTCSSYWHFNFNPNFIISIKNNIILKTCIDWYVNKYNNDDKYDYWDWSIMNAFTQTLFLENYKKESGVYYLDNMKIQIIEECTGTSHYDAHNIYNNIRVFNNRQENWDDELHKFK
jgi:mannosyltransferase OCH1-like enzyme